MPWKCYTRLAVSLIIWASYFYLLLLSYLNLFVDEVIKYHFHCTLPKKKNIIFTVLSVQFQNGVLYRAVSPDVLMLDQSGHIQVSVANKFFWGNIALKLLAEDNLMFFH